jgi:hypothetical protein
VGVGAKSWDQRRTVPHAREDMERGKLWSHRDLAQKTLSTGSRGRPKTFRHASGCICGRFCRTGYRKVAYILQYPFLMSLGVVARVTVLSALTSVERRLVVDTG